MESIVAIPPSALLMIQILGLPGLIFVIWYGNLVKDRRVEMKRDETRQEYMQMIGKILQQYRDDVTEVRRLYENNARLCDDWDSACKRQDKLIYELMNVISLNSQAFTKLDNAIKQSIGAAG
jgi:type I site-specific restriction-modification system R (restriction) subunit